MNTSEQLERQAEETRARIVEDVDELRERVSPGQILDETLDFTREGRAGQFVRNLGQQIVDNPIPTALVAAGLGWLIWGGRPRGNGYDAVADATEAVSDASKQAADTGRHIKQQTAAATASAAQSARETGGEWSARARESAANLGEQAQDLAARTSDAIGDAAATGYRGAAEVYDATVTGARRARDAVGRSATAIGESAANSAGSFAAFLKDEPLVLAGIGVALGAAIGAMFPSSETEDRLMGEASDNLKEGASELVEREWEKGKEVAEKAFEDVKQEVKQEAADLGLVSNNSSGRPSLVPEKENGEKEPTEKVS